MTIETSPLPHWFIPIFENEAVAGEFARNKAKKSKLLVVSKIE